MHKAQRHTARQDKEDKAMKRYETPTAEVLTLDTADLITTSFGNLPEVDGEGTDTPVADFAW